MSEPFSILSDPILPRLMSTTATTESFVSAPPDAAFATTDPLYTIDSDHVLRQKKDRSSSSTASGLLGDTTSRPKSLGDLPNEILHLIIVFTYSSNVTVPFGKHLEWFAKSVLLVSKKFYLLGLKLFVNYCRFTCPQTFDIFTKHWGNKRIHPGTSAAAGQSVYKYINVLDFQEFTSVGLGRTNRMNNEIQMVTRHTILSFLQKAENLKEFLSSENIQNDISMEILAQVFFSLKSLHSIDFCGSTGANFSSAFRLLLDSPEQVPNFANPLHNLTNLSFHDCTDIPNEFFARFLPLLPNLEKLDLFHTKITGESLVALNENCQLTHLSIGCCYQLDKRFILQFFITHPATKARLKWLNMETDNVNSLTERELLIILKSFTFSMTSDDGAINSSSNVSASNYNLKYLNINGRPITTNVLNYIKQNFILLRSLHIQGSLITQDELISFLSPPTKINLTQTHDQSVISMQNLNAYFNSTRRRSSVASLNDYIDSQRDVSTSAAAATLSATNHSLNPRQLHTVSSMSSIRSAVSSIASQESDLNMELENESSSSSVVSTQESNENGNADHHHETGNPNQSSSQLHIEMPEIFQQLRYINVKGNREISNNWALNNPMLIEACPSLLAWEFDLSVLENAANETYHYHQYAHHHYNGYNICNMNGTEEPEEYFWKIFQTNGRRSWLYKLRSYNEKTVKYANYSFNLDKDYYPKNNLYQNFNGGTNTNNNSDNNEEEEDIDYEILTDDPSYMPNVTQYDMATGQKIEPKMMFYPFLKYASRKIDMSNGPFYTGEHEFYKIWPVRFSERGIYKYYALMV